MKKALVLVFLLLLQHKTLAAAYPPPSGYGGYGAATTNVLVTATPFTITASDWAPIVVSGAGTAGANGNYYQSLSNLVSGVPYAVWTNSNASAYRIVLNDTNVVPAAVFSNYWAIENTINVNYAYDIISPTPFGTWGISGSGGTPGVAPSPLVGTHIPPLISASAAAAGGVLTISPGNYDLQGYIWYPTNLTVVAYGATICSENGLTGIQPVGFFTMYGGSLSNGVYWGPGSGSLLLRLDTSTNNVSFAGSKLFGSTDTIAGSINSDNFLLSVVGCEFGTFWDVATFQKAAGLSNTVFSVVSSRFYSITNGMSTASTLITSGANQTRVSGSYLQQGLGFLTGGGLVNLTANTTNEINGTVIITVNNLPKIQQSSGVVVIDGRPYGASDYKGTVNFPPIYYPTNLVPVACAPDFNRQVAIFSTNSVVQFQACTNVDTTKIMYQECMIWITNTAPGTPRAIIAPVNCTTNGRALSIPFVTNLTQVIFRQYGGSFTNMEAKPIF